ncbi:restriction endonuclease [Sphingomonas sp. RHCKR7]|uniref:restriction endonuclease n=1 Tax=Sphingomonas folli TaxID=2862497 RepID=UPI001C6661B4|nr:restriction endonuclease [Sphingomonas folli]MBW6528978.1 restriction endonuclease [Sphingomonas folli]
MTDMRFGALGDARRAVRSFVQDRLALIVTAVDGERVVDLEVSFTRFLADHGIEENLASELSTEQYPAVRHKVADHIVRWSDQGLSPPFGFHVEQEGKVVTWRHDRFEELTGHPAPTTSQFEVQAWVAALLNRDFLLPCACYLRALGCDPVLITDGSRDEGIDLIGLLKSGPLRSTVVYVQAKSQARLSGDELLREFGKFAGLPQTEKHRQYLEALGFSRLRDGASALYLCMVNGDFEFAAENHARNVGALLRSRRQMADQLARVYSRQRLDELRAAVAIPPGADLGRNLAPLLHP